MCDIKNGELKEWLSVMEIRQSSFEDRQAKNELKMVETGLHIDQLRQDFKEHKENHLVIAEQVKINTKQLIELRTDLQPIHEGVHAIQESVKVLGWLGNAIKWIAATIGGASVVIYGWAEHISQFFKGNH